MGVVGSMDWIDLTLYRDKWWAFVNIIINLVPLNVGNFLTRCGTITVTRNALFHGPGIPF
jgi:hypothetical protein